MGLNIPTGLTIPTAAWVTCNLASRRKQPARSWRCLLLGAVVPEYDGGLEPTRPPGSLTVDDQGVTLWRPSFRSLEVQRPPGDQVARIRRTAGPTGTRSPGPAEALQDAASSAVRLTPIQHLVVLRLESHWFDLGYMRLKGGDEGCGSPATQCVTSMRGPRYQRMKESRYGPA